MCIAFFSWQPVPDRDDDVFIVAHNRDEIFERQTEITAKWNSSNSKDPHGSSPTLELYAPRDCEAGGTWIGIETKSRRIAFLTNVRQYTDDRASSHSDPPIFLSRGELVLDFLSTRQSPHAFLTQLRSSGRPYRGFNLVVFAQQELGMISYGADEKQHHISMLPHGSYGISNDSTFPSSWPKVVQGIPRFEQILAKHRLNNNNDLKVCADDVIQNLMRCPEPFISDRLKLPPTGYPDAFERANSSILVHPLSIRLPNVHQASSRPGQKMFGTRTSIVLISVGHQPGLWVEENLDRETGTWHRHSLELKSQDEPGY